jgi:hypothetical protein
MHTVTEIIFSALRGISVWVKVTTAHDKQSSITKACVTIFSVFLFLLFAQSGWTTQLIVKLTQPVY